MSETEIVDPKHARRDLRTLSTAVRNGWDIPPEIMQRGPAIIAQIMETGTNRERLAAGRVLNDMWKAANAAPVVHQHAHVQIENEGAEFVERKRAALLRRIVGESDDSGGT